MWQPMILISSTFVHTDRSKDKRTRYNAPEFCIVPCWLSYARHNACNQTKICFHTFSSPPASPPSPSSFPSPSFFPAKVWLAFCSICSALFSVFEIIVKQAWDGCESTCGLESQELTKWIKSPYRHVVAGAHVLDLGPPAADLVPQVPEESLVALWLHAICFLISRNHSSI